MDATSVCCIWKQQRLLCFVARAARHARYEYPVSHWGRKQTSSGLSGWLYQAWGSSLLGVGERQVRLMVKQRNSTRTFLPSLPLPRPTRLPFPSEQSQPTGTGSDGERRFIQTGQFLWPRSDEGSQGRQRQAEKRGRRENTHSMEWQGILFGCVRLSICV